MHGDLWDPGGRSGGRVQTVPKMHALIQGVAITTGLDLQREVHRVYCIANYNDVNLKKLTKKDREKLELVVRVDKGSSIFETLL